MASTDAARQLNSTGPLMTCGHDIKMSSTWVEERKEENEKKKERKMHENKYKHACEM